MNSGSVCSYCLLLVTYKERIIIIPIKETGSRMTKEKMEQHLKELEIIGFKTNNLPKIFTVMDTLDFECINGHVTNTTLRSIKRVRCCNRCKKISHYLEIKKVLEKEGYIVLTEEDRYDNVNSKIEYICNKNHTESTTCTALKQGRRCKICGIEKSSNSKKREIDEVYNLFSKEDYTILKFSEKYCGEQTRVNVKCSNNHIYDTTISNFVLGYRCRKCYIQNNKGENSPNWTGLTPLKKFIRHTINEWKNESLRHAEYKCFITGISGNFHIHHRINFTTILKEVLTELDLPILEKVSDYENNLNDIVELNLKKHYDYGLGIVMLKEVHILFHSIYGKQNNTMEQVLEFKKHYEDGKYPELLATNK